ncbi:MAG: 50S ribosomal protein L32 [Clostridia bacterium]
MAVPKSKISKQRKRKRRTHWKLEAPGFVRCPQCHTFKLPHKVCKECGYYKGKQVVNKETE